MKTCSVIGCDRPFYGKGLCKRHWTRLYRTGSVKAEIPIGLFKGKPRRDNVNLFSDFVIKSETCWGWCGEITRNGYARFTNADGKRFAAHRFSYELHKGKIPEGMIVCHTCNNKSCSNPAHLEIGTHLRNSQMALADNLIPTGSRCHMAIMSEDDVLTIRALVANNPSISRRDLAKRYGVVPEAISNVIHRKTWKHI